MKYIDADKLIAEIDNIIEMAVERWDNEQVTGAKKLRDLLDAKIDSLQQEQPELPPIGYAETCYQKGLSDGIIKGQMEILMRLEGIENRKAEPVLVIKEREQPEMSEFEKKLWEIMKSEGSPIGPMDKFTQDDKRVFHTYSNQLLNLARKELTCQGNIVLSIEDFVKRHIEAQEVGRKEALKDLPRWVKVDEGVLLDKHSNYLLYSNGVYYYCCGTTITRDGYMLLVDDLKKLPKEDEK